MKFAKGTLTASCIFALWLGTPFANADANLSTLVVFSGTNGAKPSSGLLLGADGNFYGTTMLGGANEIGTVFRMTPEGELTTVASFDGRNGKWPSGDLVQGRDGSLYGTACQGGNKSGDGVVFKLAPNGSLTAVFSFSDYDDKGGESPDGFSPNRLVGGNDNNFYGTTARNRFGAGAGTVFTMTPNGSLTTFATFDSHAEPAWLVKAGDGRFYFTMATMSFRLASLNTLQSVKKLGSLGNLVQGRDGSFYGTSFEGGPDGGGVIFRITASGTTTNLVAFDVNYSPHGRGPSGLIQGGDGCFYGTTFAGGDTNDKPPTVSRLPTRMPNGTLIYPKVYEAKFGPRLDFGTVFRMTPNGAITTLAVFNRTNGCYPTASVVEGKDGSFYGTTTEGGLGPKASGTVFRLPVPAKEPKSSR
jgi:uncharacterized repeat protein (TIGR03803 family)